MLTFRLQRFFGAEPKDLDNKGNLPPGTIVTQEIVDPFKWDFYLQVSSLPVPASAATRESARLTRLCSFSVARRAHRDRSTASSDRTSASLPSHAALTDNVVPLGFSRYSLTRTGSRRTISSRCATLSRSRSRGRPGASPSHRPRTTPISVSQRRSHLSSCTLTTSPLARTLQLAARRGCSSLGTWTTTLSLTAPSTHPSGSSRRSSVSGICLSIRRTHALTSFWIFPLALPGTDRTSHRSGEPVQCCAPLPRRAFTAPCAHPSI